MDEELRPSPLWCDARAIWALIRDSAYAWSEDRASRKGAALAYYMAFSLAPMLIIATAVAGLIFGEAAKGRRRRIFEQSASDPSLRAHGFAVMAGPEALPPEMFTEEHRARVLGA